MRKQQILKTLAVVVASVWLAGCASTSDREAMNDGAMGSGADGAAAFNGKDLSESEKQLLSQRVYYFDLDSYAMADTDQASIDAHARYLKNYPRTHIRIEGHTDERGSREYNVGLGEHRGNTVANALSLRGVPREQISVVSYGKEKPAALGHDQAAWAQNRRGIIQYEITE